MARRLPDHHLVVPALLSALVAAGCSLTSDPLTLPEMPEMACQEILEIDDEVLFDLAARTAELWRLAEQRSRSATDPELIEDLAWELDELPVFPHPYFQAPPAELYAELGDLFVVTGRPLFARRAYAQANRAQGPTVARCGGAVGERLYTVEIVPGRHGRRLTGYLLAVDPFADRVLERYLPPGRLQQLSVDADGVEVTYALVPWSFADAVEHSFRLVDGEPDRPLALPLHPFDRLRALEAGKWPVEPFLRDARGRPRSRFTDHGADEPPTTLEALEEILRYEIVRDPTQPWYRFWLGQSLWHEGRSREAERTWRQLLAARFPGAAFYDYAWMAWYHELYAQHDQADAAFRKALDERRRLPEPVGQTMDTSRRIDAALTHWTAGLDVVPALGVERRHSWWLRVQELGGRTERDLLRAALWVEHFERRGDEASRRREQVRFDEIRRQVRPSTLAVAHADYALFAAVASLAALVAALALGLGIAGQGLIRRRRRAEGRRDGAGPPPLAPCLVALSLAALCFAALSGATLHRIHHRMLAGTDSAGPLPAPDVVRWATLDADLESLDWLARMVFFCVAPPAADARPWPLPLGLGLVGLGLPLLLVAAGTGWRPALRWASRTVPGVAVWRRGEPLRAAALLWLTAFVLVALLWLPIERQISSTYTPGPLSSQYYTFGDLDILLPVAPAPGRDEPARQEDPGRFRRQLRAYAWTLRLAYPGARVFYASVALAALLAVALSLPWRRGGRGREPGPGLRA